jgi:hypothetical protein
MASPRSAGPALRRGPAGLIRRCPPPSWIHRAPQRSHHALGEGLTRMTMWGDSQTGHHATATSLVTPRSVGVRDWWRERRSVALLEPQARCLLTASVAAGMLSVFLQEGGSGQLTQRGLTQARAPAAVLEHPPDHHRTPSLGPLWLDALP